MTSVGDDNVFDANTRRSTLGEIDISIMDEDPKPVRKLDFKTLAMATSAMLEEEGTGEDTEESNEANKKLDFKMLAKLTSRIQVEGVAIQKGIK